LVPGALYLRSDADPKELAKVTRKLDEARVRLATHDEKKSAGNRLQH
jgi:hypothetical protein